MKRGKRTISFEFVKLGLFLAFIFYKIPHAKGQDTCMVDDFFSSREDKCTNSLRGANCVSIDITGSVDSLAENFIYEWDLGDGTKKRGYKVDHCYNKYGHYKAILNLYDSINDVQYPEELLIDLIIREPVEIELHTPDTVYPGKPAVFDYSLTRNTTWNVTGNYWSINGTPFSCDKKIEYVNNKAAWNTAEVVITLESGGEAFEICASARFWGKDANLNGSELAALFSKDNPSPFAKDQLHFLIYEQDSKKAAIHLSPVADKDYQLLLSPGKSYSMVAWKGNEITQSIDFTTSGANDSTETFTKVREAYAKLILNKPVSLKPVYFQFDKLDLENGFKKNLETNLQVIKKYPFLKFKIGTYTHTKGLVARNFRLSTERSGYLLKYLINKGIEKERIEIANPNDDKSLINTCLEFYDCPVENEKLNKRSDFVVLSVY